MGRPRAFDEATVIEQVAALLVERGYDAVSVDEIVRVTGLGRGSLYKAFGSKAGLMARVLADERRRRTGAPAGMAAMCSVVLASSGAHDPEVAGELAQCLDLLGHSDDDRARLLGAALLERRASTDDERERRGDGRDPDRG